jgi:hypothetical protein
VPTSSFRTSPMWRTLTNPFDSKPFSSLFPCRGPM